MPEKNKQKRDQDKRDMTVQEAGHMGGETTSERYGPQFYEDIGHKGGQRVHDLVEKGKEHERMSEMEEDEDERMF